MLRFHVKLRGVCFTFRKFETTQILNPISLGVSVLERIPCVFLGRGQKSYLSYLGKSPQLIILSPLNMYSVYCILYTPQKSSILKEGTPDIHGHVLRFGIWTLKTYHPNTKPQEV